MKVVDGTSEEGRAVHTEHNVAPLSLTGAEVCPRLLLSNRWQLGFSKVLS